MTSSNSSLRGIPHSERQDPDMEEMKTIFDKDDGDESSFPFDITSEDGNSLGFGDDADPFREETFEIDESSYRGPNATDASKVVITTRPSERQKITRSRRKTDADKKRACKHAADSRERKLKAELQEREDHAKLLEETKEYKARIDGLQAEVYEMREKMGVMDLALENDLLKAQLQEHRLFVEGLLRMANGVTSTQLEKQRLYRQGVEFAVSQIHALLSRSTRQSSEWKPVKIPPTLEDQLGIRRGDISISYQIVPDLPGAGHPSAPSSSTPSRRLNLRTEQRLYNVGARSVADAYWRLWTNSSFILEYIKSFKSPEDVPDDKSTNVTTINEALEGMSLKSDPTGDKEIALATIYSKESYRQAQARHRFYVATKRECEISRGFLGGPGSMLQPMDRQKTYMCARSSSSSTSVDDPDLSTPIVSAPYVEGSITWDEVDDDTKELTQNTRQVNILSIPEAYHLDTIRSYDDLINEETQEMSPLMAAGLVAFSKLVIGQTKEANKARAVKKPPRKRVKKA